MSEVIWIVLATATIGLCSYKRLSLMVTLLAVGAVLALASASGASFTLPWVLLALTFILFGLPSVRQTLLSKHLLSFFRKVMPEMSQTEQEAIDAGTVWWDGEIFSGKPNWQKLHAINAPVLTAEEKAFLEGPVETVCAMVDEWQINHKDADLPPEIWQFLGEQKFFAMIIKKEYGGLEFSAYAQSRVLQKLSAVSAVLSTTVGVPNSLGPGELLQHYGTKAQQDYYLPRLAVGKEIPCFALTSPEAGSDAGSIPDRGVVCKGKWEGEEVIGMRLTFNKRYITLAPVATVIGLAFKLYDPDGLLGDNEELGITCALLPRDTKGLNIGNRHFPLNVPFHNGPLSGENIFVPLDYIIGGQEMAGKGWRMLMECLSVGRCITLPSSSAGAAKSIALATGAYSRIRRQFRMPIGQMEGVEEMLARIGASAYMMDAVTSFSTTGIDNGEKPSVISAISKYHLTERMRTVINDAMDVHGGKGICLGPNNYLGRGYQGMPISITVEGANILTRNMMIFGQGAFRCHPYVLSEIQAAAIKDTAKAIERFDKAVFGHIGFSISNFFGSLWFTLTRGFFNSTPYHDETARYYKRLSGYSANLAFMTDLAMGVLGGSLKRRERLSARLGDVLSHLYLASATLKRFDDQGRIKDDLPMVHWNLQDSMASIEYAMDEYIRNFPVTPVRWLMRLVVQPFGQLQAEPNDVIEHQIAHMLQTPNPTRTRLGEGQFTARIQGNLLGELEQTLDDVVAAEPIFAKVCKSIGEKRQFTKLDELAKIALEKNIITDEEAALLVSAEQGRLKTINVDDFAPEELKLGAAPRRKSSSRRTGKRPVAAKKSTTPKKSVAKKDSDTTASEGGKNAA